MTESLIGWPLVSNAVNGANDQAQSGFKMIKVIYQKEDADVAAGGKRKPTVLLLEAVNGMIVDVVCGSLGKTDQQIEQQTLGTRNHEN